MPINQFSNVSYSWVPAGTSRPNNFTAQNVFKAATTTAPGFVAQGTGTISAIPAVDANAVAQFQGTEAVASHVVWDSAGAPNHVYFRRSNGTYASPTAIASADILGSVQWQGRGATTFGSTVQAQIRAAATQAFTDTAKGTDLVFLTTATGAAVTTTALTLNAVTATFTGQVIGTGTASTAPGASFRSNGTISAIPTPSANISAQFIAAQASTGFTQMESSAAQMYLQFRRRNGTYAVPTAIASGDRLGTVSWAGQWGTTVGNLGTEDANFFAYATEAFTTSARGTGFAFEAQTIGTTTKVTALQLTASLANFAVPVYASSLFLVNDVAGTTRAFRIDSNLSRRWQIIGNNIGETGSNVGTNLEIRRYSDTAVDLGLVMAVTRSTGDITFNGGGGITSFSANKIQITTAQTPATSAAAGNAGDIAWDDTYLYVRMSTGWRRIALGAAF